MSKPKVDLTLLKRLVAELEGSLNTMDSIQTDVNTDTNEFMVEGSKAVGLAAGVMQEAAVVMVNIHEVLDGQTSKGKSEFLEKLLGPFKTGSSN